MRKCSICGIGLRSDAAAHECPHGRPCHHRADWKTPECESCVTERFSPAELAIPKFDSPGRSETSREIERGIKTARLAKGEAP